MAKERNRFTAAIVAIFLIFAAAAYAADPGVDFRVSNSGLDGDTSPGAFNPAVAHNSTDNEYLAVWYGDGNSTFEYEIYGQRLDANGNEIGSDFRISNVGIDGDLSRVALDPAVAYDPLSNRYLVIWYGNHPITPETPAQHYEIWGQLLAANGTEISGNFRISNTGADTSASRSALRSPSVAYNTQTEEYFAVWSANPVLTENFNHYDIWGQRVSSAGAEVGADVRVSEVGTNAPNNRSGFFPDVAYNSQNNEYLIAWYANDLSNAFEYEIYGQRLSAIGAELGADDFRISNIGTDGDGLRDAGNAPPSVAYNSQANQYLVVWYGDGLTTDDDFEVFGQRLDATGDQIPDATDFRISNSGPEGITGYGAFDPAVAYNSVENEYLAAWNGALGSTNENEICGQRLSAIGGAIDGDIRLSEMGADGDASRAAFLPDLAYNSIAAEYLTAFYGDGLATDDEFEVFARRLGPAQDCAPAEPTDGSGYARPKSATPMNVRLVPAFDECVTPNSSHGPPLETPSCNPPIQSSGFLTFSGPDRAPPYNTASDGTGSIVMKVFCIDGAAPPCIAQAGDQIDVQITTNVTGVRCVAASGGCSTAGASYAGKLLGLVSVRMTDRLNGPSETSPGTATDFPFIWGLQCSSGACSSTTSADAVTPGLAKEGKRAIWSLSQLGVLDGGADGKLLATLNGACPPACEGNDGETAFLVQGLFTP